MKALIVDDDFVSRLLLQEILAAYGPVHACASGSEALQAVRRAREQNTPYELICLDIMMPAMSGFDVLNQLRKEEHEHGLSGRAAARVMMTTALDDWPSIRNAFRDQCDGYLVKPLNRPKLVQDLHALGLIN